MAVITTITLIPILLIIPKTITTTEIIPTAILILINIISLLTKIIPITLTIIIITGIQQNQLGNGSK